jgi:hypothetical protein
MVPKSPSDKRRGGNNASDSFLEALRGLGEDFADSFGNDIVQGIPKTAINQFRGQQSGDLKPNQPFNLDQNQNLPNQETWEQKPRFFQQEYLDIRKREQLIWSHHEQETKQQITAILEELKKIAASTQNLAQEIQVAAEQVPVDPGVYHLNFFQRLRVALVELRKRVEESATWLSAFNQKSKKRNYYWGQFKKSGTKYTLSQERYMSTQIG